LLYYPSYHFLFCFLLAIEILNVNLILAGVFCCYQIFS
jgi:hypothetical protein